MKKIMFNDKYYLTRAVLSGQKTMTRRTIKCPSNAFGFRVMRNGVGDWFVEAYDDEERPIGYIEPTYKIGEVVAIAQSYKDAADYLRHQDKYKDAAKREIYYMSAGWNNKMFVKADLMPHAIEITNIKVERLQDCSDDDILKEGVFQISAPIYRHSNGIGYTFKGWTERGVECSSDTPKGAFKALIDKVSGKGTWESNPWCFCYEFKLVK